MFIVRVLLRLLERYPSTCVSVDGDILLLVYLQIFTRPGSNEIVFILNNRLKMLKFCRLAVLPSSKKCFCTSRTPTFVLKHLKEKSLISIVGEEAQNYLQGLITNDIYHLSSDCSSQYAIFLNSKGRVLYDTIIYRIDYKTYIIECDSSVRNAFEKYLKIFRLKRKVEITLNNFEVYSLFDEDFYEEASKTNERLICRTFLPHLNISMVNKVSESKLFKDPRVLQLGYRVLLNKVEEADFQSQLKELLKININTENDISYRKLRYSLGIGEGTADLPSGNCFPLESNCDYLHGVSFHKGCYIGQELTARTYHTGVIRKRLMPIFFVNSINKMPIDNSITHEKLKLGKLRGIEGNIGLALLRTDIVSTLQCIKIAGIEAVVKKPFWWPLDAPKDSISLKNEI